MDFDFDRVTRNPFFAGLAGGIVALRFAPGSTWLERALNVLAGSLCAGYFGPALVDWLSIQTPGMQAAVAFAVGMFGLSLSAAALQACVQAIGDVPLAKILTSWLTKGGRK